MGTKSKLTVIREYFGSRPGESLKDFAAELRALTPEDKTELAIGAAQNLGLAAEQVDFPLV